MCQQAEFKPHPNYLKNKQISVPASLIRDKTLKSDSFRLLCYLTTNSETWKVYQKYVIQELGWGIDRFQKALKQLVEKRYVIVNKQRTEKGKFSNNSYQFDWYPIERSDEENENSNNFSVTGFPSNGKQVTTLNQYKKKSIKEEKKTDRFFSKEKNKPEESPKASEFRKKLESMHFIQEGCAEKIPFTKKEVNSILKESTFEDFDRVIKAISKRKKGEEITKQKTYILKSLGII
jgi:hypothetical protein